MAGYPISDAALDDRLAFIGTSGSGKTYNAGVGVERLLASKARVVIVDPLDVWWGLRLRPDGDGASKFKVVIFGGAHGDLPLTEHSGALIGETVAKASESCIVSLGGFPTKAAERRFMLAFLTALYRHSVAEPLHLVLDEADLWAPQTILDREGDAQKLKGQMEQIVRRGRVRGFIPWLITQRPAVLSKDVLSQADGLIAFKLTSSQDRDAIGAWIEGQADRVQGREILASLPALQLGQGVVWVPGRGLLETATFPAKATYDSSRTPKRGEVVRKTNLKPLDLGALKERLSVVEAEVKANDPKALKAEIATLKRELAKTPAAAPDPAAVSQAESRGYSRGKVDGYAEGIQAVQGAVAPLLAALPGLEQTVANAMKDADRLADWMKRVPKGPPPASAPTPAPAPQQARPVQPASVRPETRPSGPSTVTGPQLRVLTALSWWRQFGIDQPTNEQVGFIAGYSPSSGGFANLKGGLRSLGLVDYPAGGHVALTDAGIAAAPASDLEATTEAFHAQVRAKLTAPQVKVLDPIMAAYPEAISSQAVADAGGYSASSGGFANLRGSLRTIGLIDYPSPGYVVAAGWLFPEQTQ